MIMPRQKEPGELEARMPEIEMILRRIENITRKGATRLYLTEEIKTETVVALRGMGYLVLQLYKNGNIHTIVGVRKAWLKY